MEPPSCFHRNHFQRNVGETKESINYAQLIGSSSWTCREVHSTLIATFMGPTWGWQDPGGSHVGPMNFAIWEGINKVQNFRDPSALKIDTRNAQNFTFHTYSMRCSSDNWLHLRSYPQSNLKILGEILLWHRQAFWDGQEEKLVDVKTNRQTYPRKQSSWGQQWAHLGTVGPRWAPCWPHEPCYQGYSIAPALHCCKTSLFVIIHSTVNK